MVITRSMSHNEQQQGASRSQDAENTNQDGDIPPMREDPPIDLRIIEMMNRMITANNATLVASLTQQLQQVNATVDAASARNQASPRSEVSERIINDNSAAGNNNLNQEIPRQNINQNAHHSSHNEPRESSRDPYGEHYRHREHEEFRRAPSEARRTTFMGMDDGIFQRSLFEPPIRPTYSGAVPIHPVEPGKFNGDTKQARAWLREYSEACTINGYDDHQKKGRMVAYLTAEAKEWYYELRSRRPEISWRDLQGEFLSDFSSSNTSIQLFRTLSEARQKRDERPFAYLLRVLGYCRDYNVEMPEREKVEWCLRGLHRNIANTITCNISTHQMSLEWLRTQLKKWSIQTEEERQDSRGKFPREQRYPTQHYSKPEERETKPKAPNSTSKDYNKSSLICFNCSNRGHGIRDCTLPKDLNKIASNKSKFSAAREGRAVSFVDHDNSSE